MKKILLLLDDSLKGEELIDFAVNNLKQDGDVLTALFKQPFLDVNLKKIFNGKPNSLSHSYYSIIDRILNANKRNTPQEVEHILKKCMDNNVQATVDVSEEIEPGLIKETLFADILLIGQDLFNNIDNKHKAELFTIVNKVHCPVLVVPSNKTIETIVFVFDGTEASMNAIKYFNYIMPEFYQDRKVYLLSIGDNDETDNSDNLLIQYTRLHMPPVGYMRINASNTLEVSRFIKNLPQALFVVGALSNGKLDSLKSGGVFINNESHLFIAGQ